LAEQSLLKQVQQLLPGRWWISVAILVPASVFFQLRGSSAVAIFFASALALVPLAALLGFATEELAGHVGPSLGGLLNATMGNITELILGFILLWHGHVEVVKASLAGSIIGNLLLVFGLSALVGGLRREKQPFNRFAAGSGTTTLFVAVVALVMPALFNLSVFGSFEHGGATIERLSLWTAFVLLICYFGSLIFTFRTHRNLFGGTSPTRPRIRPAAALVGLAGAAALIALESEFLAGQVELAAHALGWTDWFVGLVVIATVGNAAEHSTAVMMAHRGKMDLALSVTMGSSTQIALFVAPFLVVISQFFAVPMSLVFSPLEIVAVIFSVAVVALVCLDGETNWLEGLQLLSVYVILVIFFYFLPAA
jgi:Ca2+:H+ antiporter